MKFIKTALNKVFSIEFFPITLLLFCFAAYGLLIPSLGFYWDDWPMIWFAETQGPLGFLGAFSGDRPFLSMIYILTTSVLGSSPWQWQLLSIVSRWLTALSAWWAFSKLWPEKKEQMAWFAILIAVYPGFKQTPIAVVYGNGLFPLITYFLSYGFMFMALKNPKKRSRNTILGVLTYSFCLLSTEYYIGLDMIRGVFIWYLLGQPLKINFEKIKKAFLQWLPYLIVLLLFLIWRVYIFEFPTYQPELIEDINHGNTHFLINLIYRIIHDSFFSGWVAWIETFEFPTLLDLLIKSNAVKWIIVVFTAVVSFLFLHFIKTKPSTGLDQDKYWPQSVTFFGILALLFAGWPYWITNLPITLSYPYDRFTLAFLLGSCLLIIGLLEWLIKTRMQKIILLSLLICMAIGAHFSNANTYRREWMVHNDFYWQLVWRAPQLEKGTLLLTDSLPLAYYSDNSMTAPLNLIYAPENNSLDLDYYFAFQDVRVGRSIPELKEDLEINQGFRNANFSSSTNNILAFFYSPPGCLHIIDPERDRENPVLPDDYSKMIPMSRLDQIIANPQSPALPPDNIFGKEPQHTWCYYYQKADLAKQQNDWANVVQLGETAFNLGYSPSERSEMLLFAEGYGNTGNLENALQISTEQYFENPNLRQTICSMFDRLEDYNNYSEEEISLIDTLRSKIECDQ